MLSEKNEFKMFVFQTLLFFSYTMSRLLYTFRGMQKKRGGGGGKENNKGKTQSMEVEQQMAER